MKREKEKNKIQFVKKKKHSFKQKHITKINHKADGDCLDQLIHK